MQLFGIRLVGLNDVTLTKLLLTFAVIGVVTVVRLIIVAAIAAARRHPNDRVTFWTRQGTSLAGAALILLSLLSIWFDDPRNLVTASGFATAGIAIAAQRAVTAFFGYLIIIRGNTFTVGDRIKMGGVQGDVIALGFLQTRILEMGQPPNVNEQETPGMWVRARQYSGRVVTVTNDKVFDEAIYNFTREFPFIWEELTVPVPYRGDRARAERILVDAARAATQEFVGASSAARDAFDRRYGVELDPVEPHVYLRLTDNWVELTVRFLVPEHGIRRVKDHISRQVLQAFEEAHIEIASGTYEIVGIPPIRIQHEPPQPSGA